MPDRGGSSPGAELGRRRQHQADFPGPRERRRIACAQPRSIAGETNDLGLLEEALGAVLSWDAHWDQWTPQRAIRKWLASLRNDQAASAARALRDRGEAAHFSEFAEDRNADERLRRAARLNQDPQPGNP